MKGRGRAISKSSPLSTRPARPQCVIVVRKKRNRGPMEEGFGFALPAGLRGISEQTIQCHAINYADRLGGTTNSAPVAYRLSTLGIQPR